MIQFYIAIFSIKRLLELKLMFRFTEKNVDIKTSTLLVKTSSVERVVGSCTEGIWARYAPRTSRRHVETHPDGHVLTKDHCRHMRQQETRLDT